MMDLLRGRVPLARAFWEYAIVYGAIVNLFATAAAFAAVARDLPTWVVLAFVLLPVPYLAAVVVGVWRSAGGYVGAPIWAQWARPAVVAWAALMLLV